jgi:hypothetical protein
LRSVAELDPMEVVRLGFLDTVAGKAQDFQARHQMDELLK